MEAIDFMTVDELKENNFWPTPWISGYDLPYILENLGDSLKGIEIGVCRAENIYYCLEFCSKIQEITCIDPYLEYQDWNQFISKDIVDKFYNIAILNLKKFKDKIIFIKDKSSNVYNTLIDNKYDYIFIDGEHTYEAVSEDLNNFYSKVKTGGIIAGHDYSLPGIKDAIFDFRKKINIEKELKFCKNDVWYWYK